MKKEGDLVVIINILLTLFNLTVSKTCGFHFHMLEKKNQHRTSGVFVVGDEEFLGSGLCTVSVGTKS
jgi:hypothetical protein